MKVTVRVDSEQYEVQIADLYTRPIVAEVDGRRYEVWLEETPAAGPAPAAATTRTGGRAAPAPAVPPTSVLSSSTPPTSTGR